MFPKFAQSFKKNQSRQEQRSDIEDWQQFQAWYGSELGQLFAKNEEEILAKYLPNLFGYYLLQCGCPETQASGAGSWLKSSRVSSHICIDYLNTQGIHCQSDLSQLPMKSDSLDIVVLPHVLEFSSTPHQVLREVERVLIAEGHVTILGFNPWSTWNISRFVLFWRKKSPLNASYARFLTASRVMDWLELLGFDVLHSQAYFYRPPLQSGKKLNKMSFLENLGRRFWPSWGAGYVLVARKRVQTLTPIRPRWQRARRKVLTDAFETTNRNKL